jgi:hypothetical protein
VCVARRRNLRNAGLAAKNPICPRCLMSMGANASKQRRIRNSLAFFSMLSLTLSCSAQECGVCTNNGINMPISLGTGTVRTPEFSAKRGYYNIDIEVKWVLPTDELRCKMGFAVSPSDNRCKWASLWDVTWRVLDGGEVVAEGTDSERNNSFEADSETLSRNVANFKALAHHRYVVELTFLKDASALNETQPRLIVERPGFSF